MSDPKSSYGEPVEEPRAVDDVVDSANEGMADAEAARGDAAVSEESAQDASTVDAVPESTQAPAPAEPMVDDDPTFDSAMYEAHAEDAPAAEEPMAATTAPAAAADEPVATTVVAPSEPVDDTVVAPGEPVDDTVVAPAAAAAAPQPIFVQAPESPRPRGNRMAAGAIGLLAALSFAVLYLAVWIGVGLIRGDVTTETIGSTLLNALGTWSLWVPVVVFFIAFWLLGAIINRGRWAAWVIFGLLVGLASYGGNILGALFQAPFWNLTASEGATLVEAELLAPLSIAAFIIGRELTIWFGSWASSRGARVTELNTDAQREYERTLEAGPQLTRV